MNYKSKSAPVSDTVRSNAPRLGKRIRKLREMHDYSQEFMASELDMSISGYSRIERDEVNINLDKLFAICRLLNVSVIEMLNNDESQIIQTTRMKIFETPLVMKNSNRDFNFAEDFYREQIQMLKDELNYLKDVVKRISE